MRLIDVHAHLESSRFEKDLKKVLDRFKKAGGEFVINSGVNPETNRKILEIAKKYPVVKVSFGLYPIDALAKEIESGEGDYLREIQPFDVDEELKWIEENKELCVGIGEVGLDYNWPDFAFHKEKQIENFERVIALAKKIDKPIIVHSRKAELDAVEILEKHGMKSTRDDPKGPKVVMHCFNGKRSLIKRCVENGWYFSVPPVITRLDHFKMLVEVVPMEQILTETDSPYLSPVAGERNEPANVAVTIKEIAKIKNLSEEKISETIFNNAKILFDIC